MEVKSVLSEAYWRLARQVEENRQKIEKWEQEHPRLVSLMTERREPLIKVQT
jgi:hypothetical protein